MDFPLVSCLMPTKNRRRYLPRAYKMWTAQTWPNKELIIVEDGDDIGPADIWQHHSPTLGDLIQWKFFEGTLGAKLNYAASIARGSICINWDDDDWNAPTRIADQVAHMRISGKPVVGMCSLVFYREGEDFAFERTGDGWQCGGSSHCYKRVYVLANPRPDKTLGEDTEWALAAYMAGDLSTISGLRNLIVCSHESNTSPQTPFSEFVKRFTMNQRAIPYAEIEPTVGPYRL